jgi:hypothetical protein
MAGRNWLAPTVSWDLKSYLTAVTAVTRVQKSNQTVGSSDVPQMTIKTPWPASQSMHVAIDQTCNINMRAHSSQGQVQEPFPPQ